jgi:hypothetical protein
MIHFKVLISNILTCRVYKGALYTKVKSTIKNLSNVSINQWREKVVNLIVNVQYPMMAERPKHAVVKT